MGKEPRSHLALVVHQLRAQLQERYRHIGRGERRARRELQHRWDLDRVGWDLDRVGWDLDRVGWDLTCSTGVNAG